MFAGSFIGSLMSEADVGLCRFCGEWYSREPLGRFDEAKKRTPWLAYWIYRLFSRWDYANHEKDGWSDRRARDRGVGGRGFGPATASATAQPRSVHGADNGSGSSTVAAAAAAARAGADAAGSRSELAISAGAGLHAAGRRSEGRDPRAVTNCPAMPIRALRTPTGCTFRRSMTPLFRQP